jgi:hypothetical protein
MKLMDCSKAMFGLNQVSSNKIHYAHEHSVLVDGMWAQLQYGSELSEFSVTFSISYRYPPTWVPSQKKLLVVLSRNRQRQGLDVRAFVLSALQSVNVSRFWEECMIPAFFSDVSDYTAS